MAEVPIYDPRDVRATLKDVLQYLNDQKQEQETSEVLIVRLEHVPDLTTLDASQDGIMLWDAANANVVVSQGGTWRALAWA